MCIYIYIYVYIYIYLSLSLPIYIYMYYIIMCEGLRGPEDAVDVEVHDPGLLACGESP